MTSTGTVAASASVSLPVPSSKHIPALDGVRAIAILAVVIFHFFQHRPLSNFPYEALFRKITNVGSGGVDLFFVLSGFLITGILIDARGRAHALRNFYMRRVLRIFPLYYGFLLVVFLLLPLLAGTGMAPWHDQVWFWTYTSNIQATFSQRFPDGPEHFWSLAIEEQFYLVWPFVAMRYPVPKLAWICCGVIVGAIVARAVVAAAGFNPYYFTLGRMDALACGALLASAIRLPGGADAVRVWGRKLVVWIAPVMALVYILMSGRANPVVQVAKYTFIAALCTCFMVMAINSRPGTSASRLLTNPILRSVGTYSYGMYVLHPAIVAFLQANTLTLPIVVTLPLAIASTYLVAWCVWHVWEQPFLRLKRLFPSNEGAA